MVGITTTKSSVSSLNRPNSSYRNNQLITLHDVYLRIRLLAQINSAIIKSRDGVNTPDASNSNSQCSPVNPIGHRHSYFFGGL